jgi:hypothetical protein
MRGLQVKRIFSCGDQIPVSSFQSKGGRAKKIKSRKMVSDANIREKKNI